ncbi:RibD family protein [Thermanaerothrix sp.]|jgi:3,4-dihydroxy 2-butanone 4-phosphate synthase/GTP cyclohydrolase II|uniref:RibD family protein n=1 Tax=Thermanaerothrix sp. TaxID=2972675 RepID=UPI002ADE79E4|nr:RibD family protein [Thermanaerothrix sp.]
MSAWSTMVETAKSRIREWQAEGAHRCETEQRPWVTLAFAQSLDGCLTFAQGHPSTLSGEAALHLTHTLRAEHQAILVGVGTVLADNPRLTVRLVPGQHPQPLILDTHLRTPLESHLLHHPTNAPWIFTAAQAPAARRHALEELGARIVPLVNEPGEPIPLHLLLNYLWAQGIRSLMVEGGAKVLAAFLEARLFDAALITLAPIWIGGYHYINKLLVNPEREAPGLTLWQVEMWDQDLIIWGRPKTHRL